MGEATAEADEDEPPFVVAISWRSHDRPTEKATDALGAALQQFDHDNCLQLPTPPDDIYSVTLAGHNTARTAAIDALSLLTTSAVALGLTCDVVSVDVLGDEGSWVFDLSELDV